MENLDQNSSVTDTDGICKDRLLQHLASWDIKTQPVVRVFFLFSLECHGLVKEEKSDISLKKKKVYHVVK